jgi:hypothetical protein
MRGNVLPSIDEHDGRMVIIGKYTHAIVEERSSWPASPRRSPVWARAWGLYSV